MMVSSTLRLSRTAASAVVALLLFASAVCAQTPTLAWNRNPESTVTGYVVEYGTTSGSPSTTLDVGNVISRQITGLQSGRTYYFRVRAYNSSGQRSGPSTELAYATPGTPSQPVVSGVTPSSGPTGGGTVITIAGSSFVSGATVRVGSTSATGVTFVSSTQLRATTPPGTVGAKSVQVVNPGGLSATRSSAFTYTSGSSQPTYASVSPTSGPTTGGTVVTVTGTGFVSGATVRFGAANATSVTFVSSTQLRATTPPYTAGLTSVQIVNPGGLSATRGNAFTYYTASGTQPTISGVSPSSGPTGGGTVITIAGSNFVSGATVRVGGTSATGVTRVSSTQLRATTPPGTVGLKAVQVVNPGGLSATRSNAFTYTSSGAQPTYGSVSPTWGPTSGGTLITVTGTGFVSGATVRIGAANATSVTFVSSTQLRARTPPGPVGQTSVQIINPGGLSATRGRAFNYYTASSSVTETTELASVEAGDLEAAVLSSTAVEAEATAAPQTADATNAATDTDADGLPDAWEGSFGLASDSAQGDNGAEGDPDADGVPNATEYLDGTHPRGLVRRFFAEGASTADVQTRFVIANATPARAAVVVSFFDASGKGTRVALTVPARARRTIDASSIAELQGKAFATELESDQVVAFDRSMSSSAGFGPQIQTAAEQPAMRWRLAAGSTRELELFYLLQNPNDVAAEVEVGYHSGDGAHTVTKTYQVPPHGRLTLAVDREDPALAAADVSGDVTSTNVPIVVERSMYVARDGKPALALAAMGVAMEHTVAAEITKVSSEGPETAARWLIAEAGQGDASGESTPVVVSNTDATPVAVRVTLLFEDAVEQSATFEVGGAAQLTISIAQAFPAAAGRPASLLVEGVDPAVPAGLLVTRKPSADTNVAALGARLP
jgi:IPT/TIG domain/Fibronectin type III domain